MFQFLHPHLYSVILKLGCALKFISVSVSADKFFFFPMQTQFPVLSRLNELYNEIPAFQDAMPEKQPDTPLTSAS